MEIANYMGLIYGSIQLGSVGQFGLQRVNE